jgi:hypothetical protein
MDGNENCHASSGRRKYMTGPMHLFMFGAGYTARAFARTMAGRAASMAGTARDAEGMDRLRAGGITPFLFDGVAAGEDAAAALWLRGFCLSFQQLCVAHLDATPLLCSLEGRQVIRRRGRGNSFRR